MSSKSNKPNKKRKYNNRSRKGRSDGSGQRNVRAGGGPAILFTCEGGRESRVRREAMQLLDYYCSDLLLNESSDDGVKLSTTSEDAESKPLSLEEEIKQLKRMGNRGQKDHVGFSVCHQFEVKGTVLVQCDVPECVPLEPCKRKKVEGCKDSLSKDEESSTTNKNKSTPLEENVIKRERVDPEFYRNWPWDPVQFVKKVLNDSAETDESFKKKGEPIPPSSRFIARIVPLQATCYASLDEIALTVEPLIQHFIFSKDIREKGSTNKTKFAISIKRRNCNHIDRMECIQMIAKFFDDKKYCVDLKNPKFTILVEICKSFCGISVVQDMEVMENFNIQESRRKRVISEGNISENENETN